MNPLRTWLETGSPHLESLTTLDVTGVTQWIPNNNVLGLPRFKSVTGMYFFPQCHGCNLVRRGKNLGKSAYFQSAVSYYCPNKYCYCEMYRNNMIAVEFAKERFFFRCDHKNLSKACHNSLRSTTKIDNCCSLFRKLNFSQLPFAITGIFLNGIVIIIFLYSRSLHSNVTMLLSFNMAIGDACISLYSIFLFRLINDSATSEVYIIDWKGCYLTGPFLLLGFFLSVPTSFLLTLERYLAVEFALNPNFCLRMRLTLLLLLLDWLVSIVFTSYAVSRKYFHSINSLCLLANLKATKRLFPITVFYIGIGMMLYLATIPMYGRIYLVFRRSGQQAGVRRHSSHTKRIASLVLTNVILFFFPILLRLVFHFVYHKDNQKVGAIHGKIANWVLVFALNINAVANPLLNVYRNGRFTKAFKKLFRI